MGRVWTRRTRRSCFSRSSPRSRRAKGRGSVCRSATASSTRMAAPSATRATPGAARHFSSSCRRCPPPRLRKPARQTRETMTDRLYYTDPHGREFDAVVARVERRDGRTVVMLDRTSFYPTSGGQPFDVGTLGGVRVIDVVDDEEGEVLHVVEDSVGGDPGRPRARPPP